jgi:hypothetical protein
LCAQRAETLARRLTSRSFIHAGRQNHHGAFVENILQLKAEIANSAQHQVSLGSQVATTTSPTSKGLDAAALEFVDEGRLRTHYHLQISITAETSRPFACGRLKTSAIPLDAIIV